MRSVEMRSSAMRSSATRSVLMREMLGETLRELRMAEAMTLREVSAAARVSLGYLSEVERGQKEASSELLNAICGALDVRLSDVLRRVGDRVESHEVVAMFPLVSPVAAA